MRWWLNSNFRDSNSLPVMASSSAQRLLRQAFPFRCQTRMNSFMKPKASVSPLELEDAEEAPIALYRPRKPYVASITSVQTIAGQKGAPEETCHIVIDHGGNVPYWEGQSYGVIPPAAIPSYRAWLYSIASSRYGDFFDGKTASLCVQRSRYYDLTSGEYVSGVCSNHLCDSKPGDSVKIIGPYGGVPQLNQKHFHIMIAVGCGVAPYRGFLRRMFMEDVGTYSFSGVAWLFHEVESADSLLYNAEFTQYVEQYPNQFKYGKVFRSEQKYIEDKVEEFSSVILNLLDAGASIYFSGPKEMMPGIRGILKRAVEQRGETWKGKRLAWLRKHKQWHPMVY